VPSMARAPDVTFEEVIAAYDQLITAGERPNARALLAQVGRGSLSTIHRFLTRIEAERPHPVSPVQAPGWVVRLVAEIRAAADRAEAAAPTAVEQDRAGARVELEAQLADLQLTIGDLQRDLDEAGEHVQADAARIRELEDAVTRLQGELRHTASERDDARQELGRERQAAEAARQELAKAQLRLEALPRMEADLEAARQGHAHLTKTLDVCATERASLQAKAGAQVSAIEELHARLAVMEDGLAAERKTGAALDRTLATAQAQAAAAQAAAQQARTDLTEAKQEATELRKQLLQVARGQTDKAPKGRS